MSATLSFVTQSAKMLGNLKVWLNEAGASAAERDFNVDNFATARLAPDMFPLIRQVQACCDTAKLTASRLSGKAVPKHEDTETTFAELHQRIDSTLEILGGFTAADFEGAEDKVLVLEFLGGATAIGGDYVSQFATPNFYFHMSMAYAILRHNGVKLGKRAFLGSLPLKPPAAKS